MSYDILYALWFFLPAGVANAAPVFAARLPVLKKWDYPMDGRRTLRGKRMLGDNKTFRGIVFGTIIGFITFILQQNAVMHLGDFSSYILSNGYTEYPAVLGVLLGFGALAGDALASFFKRQLGILPGNRWIPFDQLDYIIGSSICAAIVAVLSFNIYVWAFILWFVAHLVFSYIGFRFGLKRTAI